MEDVPGSTPLNGYVDSATGNVAGANSGDVRDAAEVPRTDPDAAGRRRHLGRRAPRWRTGSHVFLKMRISVRTT